MARDLRTYRAEGVVLRRRNLGEADTVFTVFSEREGKFEGVARGVRKATSRMRGHLEPLTMSRFQLAHGRSIDIFTQAETIRSFPRLRDELDRCTAAIACAELVDRFSLDHAENRSLYRLLVATLEALEETGDLALVRRYFELHLLDGAGFQLQLFACALCSGRLHEEETLLSMESGGLVCRSCRSEAGAGRLLSIRAVKVLRHAARSTLEGFASLTVGAELHVELDQVMSRAVRFHLEREPNATDVLRQMAQADGVPGTVRASPV